ncbi:MAG: T9SS type A sorting domain-containing protein [Dysgonamonadaceae bacterium]|jgi:uncharacterized repeat protein (TIGR02543 family)|nr:T9SS type A sorting domain-containing protein [Dysgonamonadaceae bacterium]
MKTSKIFFAKLFVLTFIFGASFTAFADEPFTQEKPVWKALFVLYPNADINSKARTVSNDVQVISDEKIENHEKYAAAGFKWAIEESTHHRIEVQPTVVVSRTELKSADLIDTGYGNYALRMPKADRDEYNYDSYDVVFVTAQHKEPSWAGLSWGPMDGGPPYINVVDFLSDENTSWNAYMHEFTHGFSDQTKSTTGSKHQPVSGTLADEYSNYGYSAENQQGNPWFQMHPFICFYHDIFEGTLKNYNTGQKYLGVHPSLWRYNYSHKGTTAKPAYPAWDLRNSFITYEFFECSGKVNMYDQDIPMLLNNDYEITKDTETKTITLTGIKDYTGTLSFSYENEPVKYTVTYETNSEEVKEPISVDCHTQLTEPKLAPKAGYTFDGWFTEPEFYNKWLFDYGVFHEGNLTPDGDLTLYARWIPVAGGNIINLADDAAPSSGEGWTYASNVYTVLDGANVVIAGASTTKRVVVASGATATITLDGVEITPDSKGNYAPLTVTDANVTLLLSKRNTLTASGSYSHAAIEQSGGGTLIINNAEETAGVLYATGGKFSAGIGGKSNSGCGTIIINGGVIFASSDVTYSATSHGAAIGGGRYGKDGNITINGGVISAVGKKPGVAIGNGESGTINTVTINGGTVYASAGNARPIGNGNATGEGITIGVNAVVFMTSNSQPFAGTIESGAIVREETVESGSFLTITQNTVDALIKGTNLDIHGNAILGVPVGGTLTIDEGLALNNYGRVLANSINGVKQQDGISYGDIVDWNSGNRGNINTAVRSVNASFEYKVYPNPVRDILFVESEVAIEKIEITDLSGRTVIVKRPVGTSAKIDVSELANGVYFVAIETEKGKTAKKIIK